MALHLSRDSIDSVVEEVVFVLPEVPAGVERRPAALDHAGSLAVELLLEPDHVVLLVLLA